MQFNRGEWSELYALLEILDNQNLNIVNDHLEIVDDSTFKILGMYIQNSNNEYYLNINNLDVDVLKNNILHSNISKEEIKVYKEILLEKILGESPSSGSFPIKEMKDILEKLTEGNKIKSSAERKEDLIANLYDSRMNTVNKVGYSIKSSLGRPATLLNASSHTNFKYKVIGLTSEDVEIINNINTNKKLLDRLKYITNKNCNIQFASVVSESMNHNLKMIDSEMPELLAKILLLSYEDDEKDLKKLLDMAISKDIVKYNSNKELYYNKKIGDLLLAITLGMIPGTIWNGNYDVTGGIILVENKGQVLVLDAIYYKEYLIKYLIKNTKLDSPSSTRYGMLDIYEEGREMYFNLNLQIRFKR
ncbi:MAG: HpaII family restriction endonuclease [Oscillospiraceae bacterium]|nr:HpaII family restriction endonuclease [Oscillospiraceae bacterium]